MNGDDDCSPNPVDVANLATVQESLVTSLGGPLKVQGDAGMVEARPASDMIMAANYLAGIVAAQTRRLGVRYARLRPGATVQGARNYPRWRDGAEW